MENQMKKIIADDVIILGLSVMFLAFAVFGTSCTTQQKAVDSWKGYSLDSLIQVIGAPYSIKDTLSVAIIATFVYPHKWYYLGRDKKATIVTNRSGIIIGGRVETIKKLED